MDDRLSYPQVEQVRQLIEERVERAKEMILLEIETEASKKSTRRWDVGMKVMLALSIGFLWSVIVIDIANRT